MSKNKVLDFEDYRDYLHMTLEKRAQTNKGQKHKLATSIGCHAGYLSKVLGGMNDLSLEQAQATNKFLGHTPSESKYFLNLVLLARAGTSELKTYFKEELKKQKEEKLQLKNRIEIGRTLSEVHQAKYYSSWHYAATHVCVSLHAVKNKEQIAQALQLPQMTVNETLEFLVDIGILKKRGEEYLPGEVNLFLDKSSPFINQHHTNWRVRSLQSLDGVNPLDLHYSGVVTCSQKSIEKVREVFLSAIQDVRATIKESDSDEVLYCYTMDVFNLMKE